MNVLFAIDPPIAGPVVPLAREALAPLHPVHVSDADSLAERLAAEPWEIVVASSHLVESLTPDTRARLADGELILVVERIHAPDEPMHVVPDDFLLVAGRDAADAASELVERVRQAQRRVARTTRELQRNEAVARAVDDIVYRLDEEGRIVFVNEAIARLGYAPEELLGRHFSELVDPGEVERISREAVLPTLRGRVTGDDGAPRLFDERRRGARRTRQLEVVLRGAGAMRDTSFVGVVTASGDVVARVGGGHEVVGTIGVIRRDQRDSRTTQVLRSLFLVAESAPYGVVIVGADERVQYANPAFYRRFRLAPDGVNGALLTQIDLPALGADLSSALAETARGGAASSALVAGNGSGSWIRTIHPVTDPRGEVSAFLITVVPADEPGGRGEETTADLRQVIALAVDEFRAETGARVPVSVDVARGHAIPDAFAELLSSVVRTLLEFAELVTGGAPTRVAAHAAQDAPIVTVSAARAAADRSAPRAPDPMRLSALLERSESLRSRVESGGGAWSVERGEQQIAFAVRLPVSAVESGADRVASDTPKPSGSAAVARFRSLYRNNPDVMIEILRLYASEAPQRIAAIRAGLAAGDLERVIPAAHSLANTSGTLQAPAAVKVARSLEEAARAGDLEGARAAGDTLVALVEQIIEAVEAALAEES